MRAIFFGIIIALSISSCTKKFEVDSVYVNGNVYTVDSAFQVVEAFAVKDGKVFASGTTESILKLRYKNKIDLKGKFVYPGFIDAHCHFYGYGIDLSKTWLIGTGSFDAIIDTLILYKDRRFMGWVFGRGWDQNDWKVEEFPDKTQLDSLFPDVPVFLMRIDGHAALVNQVALDLAGITTATKVSGGEIIQKNGKLTGLLIDNAMTIVKEKIPEPSDEFRTKSMLQAQKNCFEVGLTSVYDAGLDHKVIAFLDSLQRTSLLKMRMYVMATYDTGNVSFYQKNGKYKTGRMNVRSFKLYADGALGSRGACLLEPYLDMRGHFGNLLSDIDSIKQAAHFAAEMGFQLNTHCIGDSANRLLLTIYSSVLEGKNDLRWRIEHAQLLNPADFNLFGDYSIIPSVQPTHATSDMYWAGSRIGTERLKTAYAYKQLLEQNGMIADGSDFPVEDINPLFGFYAAVSRKDQKGFPAAGFQKENALTREQALRAMTVWAAYSGFEETEKGSLEKGKFADFVILDQDLMKVPEEELFKLKIQSTFVNGEKVFGK